MDIPQAAPPTATATERVVRLTYFDGDQVPMVEIWTHIDEAASGIKRYDYVRTGTVPSCETQAQWLEMLGRSESTVLVGWSGSDDES